MRELTDDDSRTLSEATNGYVYAIHAPDVRRVKIGWSMKPRRRLLADIRPLSPVPLILIGITPGSKLEEAYWHQTCSSFRIRYEWFDDAAIDLLNFI